MSKSFKTDPKWLDSSDFKSFAFPNTSNESFLLNKIKCYNNIKLKKQITN